MGITNDVCPRGGRETTLVVGDPLSGVNVIVMPMDWVALELAIATPVEDPWVLSNGSRMLDPDWLPMTDASESGVPAGVINL